MITKTINQTVLIPATLAEVYAGFTDPKIHSAMTGGAEVTGIAQVGGEFTVWDGYITGKYLELESDKRLVMEWQTSEWPEDAVPSRLEIILTPKDNQTELHMIHSNVPAEQAPDYETGWYESYWEPMKVYFSR